MKQVNGWRRLLRGGLACLAAALALSLLISRLRVTLAPPVRVPASPRKPGDRPPSGLPVQAPASPREPGVRLPAGPPMREPPRRPGACRPGTGRQRAGDEVLLVSSGDFPHGRSGRPPRSISGQRLGAGHPQPRLLDGQVRGDAGAVEAGHGYQPPRAAVQGPSAAATGGRRDHAGSRRRGARIPYLLREPRRGRGILPQAQRGGTRGRPAGAGMGVPAPDRAQWEFACRAGTTTATAFGDQLSSTQANFDGTLPFNGAPAGPYLHETTPVGRYPANAWGLHDLHGNVWEWCRGGFTDKPGGGDDPFEGLRRHGGQCGAGAGITRPPSVCRRRAPGERSTRAAPDWAFARRSSRPGPDRGRTPRPSPRRPSHRGGRRPLELLGCSSARKDLGGLSARSRFTNGRLERSSLANYDAL